MALFTLVLLLHFVHAAVGVSAEHLATEEAQHGRLAIITIHHVVGTPGRERGKRWTVNANIICTTATLIHVAQNFQGANFSCFSRIGPPTSKIYHMCRCIDNKNLSHVQVYRQQKFSPNYAN